jgi:hypothetical protein
MSAQGLTGKAKQKVSETSDDHWINLGQQLTDKTVFILRRVGIPVAN